jgi:hypothetical protein
MQATWDSVKIRNADVDSSGTPLGILASVAL